MPSWLAGAAVAALPPPLAKEARALCTGWMETVCPKPLSSLASLMRGHGTGRDAEGVGAQEGHEAVPAGGGGSEGGGPLDVPAGDGSPGGGGEPLGVPDGLPHALPGNLPPAYPDTARRMGWEGEVLLRLEILPDGRVGRVHVARSSGHKVLDQEALRTVSRWRCTPHVVGGAAVAIERLLPVRFALKDQ